MADFVDIQDINLTADDTAAVIKKSESHNLNFELQSKIAKIERAGLSGDKVVFWGKQFTTEKSLLGTMEYEGRPTLLEAELNIWLHAPTSENIQISLFLTGVDNAFTTFMFGTNDYDKWITLVNNIPSLAVPQNWDGKIYISASDACTVPSNVVCDFILIYQTGFDQDALVLEADNCITAMRDPYGLYSDGTLKKLATVDDTVKSLTSSDGTITITDAGNSTDIVTTFATIMGNDLTVITNPYSRVGSSPPKRILTEDDALTGIWTTQDYQITLATSQAWDTWAASLPLIVNHTISVTVNFNGYSCVLSGHSGTGSINIQSGTSMFANSNVFTFTNITCAVVIDDMITSDDASKQHTFDNCTNIRLNAVYANNGGMTILADNRTKLFFGYTQGQPTSPRATLRVENMSQIAMTVSSDYHNVYAYSGGQVYLTDLNKQAHSTFILNGGVIFLNGMPYVP